MSASAVALLEAEVHRQVLTAGRAATESLGPAELAQLVRRTAPLASADEVEQVVDRVLARTDGLGPLEPLLADATVTEVMVNGPGRVWVERHGRLERTAVELDSPTVELLLLRIVSPLGLRVDRSSPLVDARLADGSRVNAVVPPLAVDGPCLTIRRFGVAAIPLDAIAAPPVAALLRWAVAARCNILISGATGSGKTTLLNALAGVVPRGERIVTVEDAAELRLPGDHVVRLEARPPSVEGTGEVTIRTLVRNALRMRPDRLIVGEARGNEALDLLQAMNTGHDGSLSTCHANGVDDALRRLETMVLGAASGLPLAAIRDHVCSALDLVVHVSRRADGARAVQAVGELVPPYGVRAGGARTVLLASGGEVHRLPARPPRASAAPAPDPAWLGRSTATPGGAER